MYLHVDEYRHWKGHKVKGQLDVTVGMVMASWNAWMDDKGNDDSSELVGVQVTKLTPWFQGYDYVVYDDPARAATMQQKRQEIIARLREWTVSTTDDSASLLPFETMTYKGKIVGWSDRARSFIAELYLTHAAIAQVSQRYFDGHPILFSDRQQELDRLIKGMENLIDLHNKTLAPLLPHHGIDLEAIKRAIQPHVMAKGTYFVDRAKAETLFQFDEQDAAVAVTAPYAYGDKPEVVEVRLDDHRAPCYPLLRAASAGGRRASPAECTAPPRPCATLELLPVRRLPWRARWLTTALHWRPL